MMRVCSFMGGMASVGGGSADDDAEIYFFALTDFFTEYGAATRFANFVDSCSHPAEHLSAIEPVAFADRLASLVDARTV